jgi:Signal peptidase, peptidase S26
MADEQMPKPDGILRETVYAGAPPAMVRSDAIVAGAPTAGLASPGHSERSGLAVGPVRSQISLFFCWLAGVFLLIVCGWGLIGFCCLIDRRLHWNIPFELAAGLGGLLSLGLLYYLERDLWLSRLMGLRLGPHSTQITETLFFFFTGIVGLLLRSSDVPAPAAAKTQPENDGTREIVETVVFVVVLVLLLRSFLVEAFVIPTGSMADTLYGYHKDYICPKCKYRFEVNCSSEAEPLPGQKGEIINGGVCSNCREKVKQ